MPSDVRPDHTDMSTRGFLQRRTWSAGSYNPRFATISPYLADRDVLDLGCSSGHWRDDWMHQQIAAVTNTLVGLDRDHEAVEALQDRGFDIREGNAENFDLGQTFDTVFCGEIIEHLENPGGMLRSASRHLRPDGRLVITTPNPFGFTNFIYRLNNTPRVNGDHTCWFCEDTLTQLLERCGYRVDHVRYLEYKAPGLLRGLGARIVRRLLPDRLAWSTLIVTAHPVDRAEA